MMRIPNITSQMARCWLQRICSRCTKYCWNLFSTIWKNGTQKRIQSTRVRHCLKSGLTCVRSSFTDQKAITRIHWSTSSFCAFSQNQLQRNWTRIRNAARPQLIFVKPKCSWNSNVTSVENFWLRVMRWYSSWTSLQCCKKSSCSRYDISIKIWIKNVKIFNIFFQAFCRNRYHHRDHRIKSNGNFFAKFGLRTIRSS